MDFANRLIVVTGGAGALGTAVVAALLTAGARCRVPAFSDAEAAAFPYARRVAMVPRCDLADEGDVARLYGGVTDLWASIHIAGGFGMGPVVDTPKGELMRMLDTNLVSCHLCCRAALGAFGADGGRIVNVTARPGLEPRLGAGMTAYAASKAAVAAFTQGLAAEVAARGVLVNAIAPSIIDTAANRAAMPKADHDAWPKPEEIAATIAFLASPENKVTTGAIVPVYGRS
ncbi:MAG: SDR family oxidoreductase [Alphaproteobacteria bacterium]|nr:SDR family oxidoreductase [Alphaproteobacteria bacterium]